LRGVVQSVEAVYHVHATEDPARIGAAVAALVGTGGEHEVDSLEGHFGNEITRVRIHLTGDEAESTFQKFVSALPKGLREDLSKDLDSFLDERSNLYLRLDKQKLVSGELAIGASDSLRIRVKLRRHRLTGEARAFYSEAIGGGRDV
jgi:RNA binding exosome subunit